MKKAITLKIDGKLVRVEVERNGDSLTVRREDESYTVELVPETRTTVSSRPVAPIVPPRGNPTPVTVGAIPAPITGTIKEILVGAGDVLEVGSPVVMMEAMKMDIEVAATQSGTVREICVQPGESVKEHQALIVLE